MTSPLQKRFAFTKETLEKIHKIQKKYPKSYPHAALMEILLLTQQQNQGWLSISSLEYVAQFLNIPFIKIWEVVSFYPLFHTQPVGEFSLQVCTTTPCWLRGSANVMRVCQKWLGIKPGETTVDGLFTLKEVNCLGACANGPVMRINEEYYEDLDEKSTLRILEATADKKKLTNTGSQIGRKSSEAHHA